MTLELATSYFAALGAFTSLNNRMDILEQCLLPLNDLQQTEVRQLFNYPTYSYGSSDAVGTSSGMYHLRLPIGDIILMSYPRELYHEYYSQRSTKTSERRSQDPSNKRVVQVYFRTSDRSPLRGGYSMPFYFVRPNTIPLRSSKISTH